MYWFEGDFALFEVWLKLFYPLNAFTGMKEDKGGVLSGCVKFLGSGEQKNENCFATLRSSPGCIDDASTSEIF